MPSVEAKVATERSSVGTCIGKEESSIPLSIVAGYLLGEGRDCPAP